MRKILTIAIEGGITKEEKKLVNSHGITISESKSIFGGNEIIELICVVTPILIGAISKIITAKINSKKLVSLKVNGVEITNVTEKNALSILKQQVELITKKEEKKDDVSDEEEKIKP
jgi:hypothetical protein